MRVCLVWLLLVAPVTALPPMTQPTHPGQPARVVLDAAPDRSQPKSFRTCLQLAGAYAGDKRGLAELNASGSASFSRAELAQMKQSFGGPAVVVDLRQESHALVNGLPLTWYGPSDWDNVGRTNSQVQQLETEQMQALGKTLELGPAKEDDEGIEGAVKLNVTALHSEEEACRELGLDYLRLYVTDHLRPCDAEVDRFLDTVDRLPVGTWLHFHCRGGKGRTTTFLAMYDMVRNAGQVSLEDILQRQAALPPAYRLLDTRPQSPRHLYYQERAEFIKAFYDFARQRQRGQSWTAWSVCR